MSDHHVSRRDFLHQSLLLGGLAAGSAAVLGSACGSGGGTLACMDTTGLTDAEKAMRNQLQYADRSPDPTKVCSGCRFFVANASANACGTCTLVKGPISPAGHCTSWVVKPA